MLTQEAQEETTMKPSLHISNLSRVRISSGKAWIWEQEESKILHTSNHMWPVLCTVQHIFTVQNDSSFSFSFLKCHRCWGKSGNVYAANKNIPVKLNLVKQRTISEGQFQHLFLSFRWNASSSFTFWSCTAHSDLLTHGNMKLFFCSRQYVPIRSGLEMSPCKWKHQLP